MSINEIVRDIQSFADDESEVIVDNTGGIVFRRMEKDIYIKVFEDHETGALFIEYNSEKKPYKTFLANDLARLDIFANKILEKRSSNNLFVNSNAKIRSLSEELSDTSLALIEKTCADSIFSTKITFITADAGHGKTVLLKEFQQSQAKKFLKREGKFIFWHIDLQGRELVRLNEAIMYDLGELRISGLYYSSIITLIRRGLLILAIDGFDELAAEIGGTAALGALSHLVRQLENKGTIIAASRRTFFSTQDYIKRNSMLKGDISQDCEFHEIKLENWSETEAIEYIKKRGIKKPEVVYSDLLSGLQENPEHPILTRPFLLTKIIDLLSLDSEIKAEELMKGMDNPTESVSEVVTAFIRREVNKWKLRDTETGQPYLSFEQHLTLLEVIAEEMWMSQKDFISSEEIEFFVTALCQEWKIEATIHQRIVSMARSHALLVPAEAFPDNRKFEHEEFKNYFIAKSLASLLIDTKQNTLNSKIKKILYIAQLPDSVAQYACAITQKKETIIIEILSLLHSLIKDEWKPTYLQINIGTLIPYLIDGTKFTNAICIADKVNYSSLVFENKTIENVIFENGNFLNISFKNTELKQLKFINCSFNELRIYSDSKNIFTSIEMKNCSISHLIEYDIDGYIAMSFYNPEKIEERLLSYGIETIDGKPADSKDSETKISEFKKALLRFLNIYQRTTIQYESNILQDTPQYRSYKNIFLDRIIPYLLEKEIISEREKKKNAKQVLHKAWSLNVNLDEFLKYDGQNDNHEYSKFWKDVNLIK